jgi:heme-degrading monooxygenase HmoA
MARYTYVWEYRVPAASEAEFLERYRPGGAWTQLFERAEGWLETRLLKDTSVEGRYVTIDRWQSAEAFAAFRGRFAREFEALDVECAALTGTETELGCFTEVGPERASVG